MDSSLWSLLKRHFSFQNIPLILGILLLRMMSYLPMRVIYVLGSGMGEVLYWVHHSRRRVTITNLSKCFPALPPGKIRALARAHFRKLLIGALTMPIAWWGSSNRIGRICTYRNRQILEDIQKDGRNIIILAPHFVGLEFLGMFLFSQMEMCSMYQKHRNPLMNEFLLQRRSRFGNRLYSKRSSLFSLIKMIKSSVAFYYLPDQDPGKKRGVFAKFYGIETATYDSLNRITKQSNALVLPCMARLQPFGGGYEIIFDPPLKHYPTGNGVADATTMNQAIEKLITQAPEQYFWAHRRFKTRPPGEKPFYKRKRRKRRKHT